jgi:hypothetical protein
MCNSKTKEKPANKQKRKIKRELEVRWRTSIDNPRDILL